MEGRGSTQAQTEPLQGELPRGTRLGEYEIEQVLGSGGMGTVYAAWHPVLRSRAAVKVLNRDVSHNATMVERFVSEAQAASRITHPNIIKVFGFGELADGRKYFVMEYLDGESVTAWLARGRPDPAEALELMLQVCEALSAAHHEGIVHRDLKPDNLWIARPRHARAYIKILDFGIAKAVEGPLGKTSTQTGAVLGTPQLMSPEQCTGRSVDQRTDIYAMGGILYWVYCGRPPFERESPAELIAAHLYATVPMPSVFGDLPPDLERLILACLEKDPDKRPQSAAELGQRLRAAASPQAFVAAGAPARARTAILVPATVIEPGQPPTAADIPVFEDGVPDEQHVRRPRRAWWVLAAGALAVGGSITWLASRPADRPAPPAPVAPVPAGTPQAPEATGQAHGTVSPLPRLPADDRPRMREPPPQPAVAKRARKPKPEPPEATKGAESPLPAPRAPSRSEREGLIEENPFR